MKKGMGRLEINREDSRAKELENKTRNLEFKELEIKITDLRLGELKEIRKSVVVYVWGGGEYSKIIKEYLRSVGGFEGRFVDVIDDEYYEADSENAISFSEFEMDGDVSAPVVFGFYNYSVIQEKKKRYKGKFPCMYDFHLAVVNGKRLLWDAGKAKKREAEYAISYGLFSDDKSRRVMQLYLNAATAGEFNELFDMCYEAKAYFNDITEGIRIDTLIDCGAFDGDSIHEFVCFCPDYSRIVAVEPDPVNVARLRKREVLEGIFELEVIEMGLGSKAGELHFKANGESNSFLDEDGDQVIRVTTLDDIVDKEEYGELGRIFLKMDIEGSELDALKGGENLIREYNPVMAICVYHKEEDLITIPQFINGLVGAGVYNYYLGFHGLDLAELVFYAVPKS